MIPRALKYSDIILVPRYSSAHSRSDLDTTSWLADLRFKLPVMPANMRAVIDTDIARWMSENQYMYAMHRFDVDIIKFVQKANEENWRCVSISVGVKDEDKNIITKLASLKLKVNYITIDIAHGHSGLMCSMIRHVKRCFPGPSAAGPGTFIIAGNVATYQGVSDLVEWGADIVKVGIGQGNVCTTKDKTGFTVPMYTCIEECATLGAPIIADGGIRCNGDIAKALKAGATMVMMGSQFSRCINSPAETVNRNGAVYKRYFGSASAYNKRTKRHIEGIMKEVPCNQMTYEEKLQEIEDDLKLYFNPNVSIFKLLFSVNIDIC